MTQFPPLITQNFSTKFAKHYLNNDYVKYDIYPQTAAKLKKKQSNLQLVNLFGCLDNRQQNAIYRNQRINEVSRLTKDYCHFKDIDFNPFINSSHRLRSKSENRISTSEDFRRTHKFLVENGVLSANNLLDYNQSCTGKTSQTESQRPPKTKGCCYKPNAEEVELSPHIMNLQHPKNGNDDVNILLSRIEALLNDSINEAKDLYDKKAEESAYNTELLEIILKHVKNMENSLITLYDYRLNPTTFFDFLLANSISNSRCCGTATKLGGDDMKTKFSFDSRNLIRNDTNGVVEVKGFGKLSFNDLQTSISDEQSK